MNFLTDRQNKKELLARIEDQQQKILRYEAKLSDLVKAYKRLERERDTLDETVKVLAAAGRNREGVGGSGRETEDEDKDKDGLPSDGPTEDDEDPDSKIFTLTNAVASLRVEKTESEQAYHADKKRLLAEKLQLTKTIEGLKKDIDQRQITITQLNAKLCGEQQLREKEAMESQSAMKEFQNKMGEHRSAREIVLVDNLTRAEQRCLAMEAQVEILREVNETRKENLSQTREAQPKEIDDLRSEFDSLVQKEIGRANTAEEKLKLAQAATEDRICRLELQIEELSDSVAYYDRQHQADQELITGLREAATKKHAQTKVAAMYEAIDEECNQDISALLSSISRSLVMINSANQRSKEAVHDLGLELNRILVNNGVDVHKRCVQDVQDIKQEFDSFKEQHSTSCSLSGRGGKLKRSGSEDSEKVLRLTSQLMAKKQEHNANVAQLNRTIRELQLSIVELKTKHRQELSQVESICRGKISQMEESMAAQRERSMQLIQERDSELANMNNNPQAAALLLAQISKQQQQQLERTSHGASSSEKTSDEDTMLAELFSLSKTTAVGAGGAKIEMLHYTHEVARKNAEIAQLIKEKKEAQMSLYQELNVFTDKERHYRDEIDALNRTVDLQRSCQSNLKQLEKPYLKNVILQFMLCSHNSSKMHMVKAISTALEFTAHEEEQVKAMLAHSRRNGMLRTVHSEVIVSTKNHHLSIS